MAGMNPEMMQMVPPELVGGLIEAMPPEFIANIPAEAITDMPPEAVSAMEAFKAAMGEGMSPAEAKASVMQSLDTEGSAAPSDGGLSALSAALEPLENSPTQTIDPTSEVLDFALSESQTQGANQEIDSDALDEAFEATDNVLVDDEGSNEDEPSTDDPMV